MMLRAVHMRDGKELGAWELLNEAFIGRGEMARPVFLHTEIDGYYLSTYVADGVIIATPTGSTAYALAAGGPILPPELRNILIVPVAPHLSVDRAVVLHEGSWVRVEIHMDHQAALSVDGQAPVPLKDGDQIEARASEYLNKIDAMGGALAAIEQGFIQGEIQTSAYKYQQAVESGEEIVVGVNAFQVEETVELERLSVDPAIEAEQRLRLADLRERRDDRRVAELLARVDTAAQGTENLVPLFVECVENDVTLGEICRVLRGAWGEYQPPSFL